MCRGYTAFQSAVHAPHRPCHSDYTAPLPDAAANSTQAAWMTSDSQTAVITNSMLTVKPRASQNVQKFSAIP